MKNRYKHVYSNLHTKQIDTLQATKVSSYDYRTHFFLSQIAKMKSVKAKQAKSIHTMLFVSWANLHTKSLSLGTYVLICRLFSTSQMLQRRLICYRWMNYFFDRMINVSSHVLSVRGTDKTDIGFLLGQLT